MENFDYDKYIQKFCLMDNILFATCFQDYPEGIEYILRIILDKKDLRVKKVQTQRDIENMYGHSVIFDVFATDSKKVEYNIEIQQANDGAIPKRARYNSAMMDYNLLAKGDKYRKLPTTYVIFITLNDVLKKHLPIYHIKRVITETGDDFGDGTNIIYVNVKHRADTELGRLMQDFLNKNPHTMFHAPLAKIVDNVKNGKERQKLMTTMEKFLKEYLKQSNDEAKIKWRAEGKAEGEQESLLKNIRILMKKLNLSAEATMDMLDVSPDRQKELASLI